MAGSGCIRRLATSNALVPPLLDRALDERYSGWRLATFSGDAACQAQAGASPVAITGDLDSDSRDDRALLIETPQGLRIVAAMRELDAFRIFELDQPAAGSAARYLYLEARGKRFPSGMSGLDDHFSHPTVAAATCGGAERIAYVWTGITFQRIVLGG